MNQPKMTDLERITATADRCLHCEQTATHVDTSNGELLCTACVRDWLIERIILIALGGGGSK